MTHEEMLKLVERLRAKRSPDAFVGANMLHNPDGPEAADLIEALTHDEPSEDVVTDEQVRKHHRYRILWEDFQTVEKDLRACALLIGHHYNSLRPVADALEQKLVAASPLSRDRLREALEIVEGLFPHVDKHGSAMLIRLQYRLGQDLAALNEDQPTGEGHD